ncbi:hypothetical protein KUCAC02_016970 [Chaenocephalus aceratus]|nr:hypothetical protein KUCAC02_016970 [Chaenocephalus aceratus]
MQATHSSQSGDSINHGRADQDFPHHVLQSPAQSPSHWLRVRLRVLALAQSLAQSPRTGSEYLALASESSHGSDPRLQSRTGSESSHWLRVLATGSESAQSSALAHNSPIK